MSFFSLRLNQSCTLATKDYECNAHDDPNDYGYGFILRLHPGHQHSLSNNNPLLLFEIVSIFCIVFEFLFAFSSCVLLVEIVF